jgi:hypothetical protein
MRRIGFETIVYRVGGDYRGHYGYFNPLPTSTDGYECRCIRCTDV